MSHPTRAFRIEPPFHTADASPSSRQFVAVEPRSRHLQFAGSQGRYSNSSGLGRIAAVLFSACVVAALVCGWLNREEELLTPDSGLGYWLGIAGALMMLLLLAYPLRKRLKLMRGAGSVPSWFRLHMVLGILGPMLIVLHSNFKIGSLNSSVALFAMLLVVASGILGRYLYAAIHKGLYGKKAELAEIIGEAHDLLVSLDDELDRAGGLVARLREFEEGALNPHRGVTASLYYARLNASKVRHIRREVTKEARTNIESRARQENWPRSEKRRRWRDINFQLALYCATIRRALRFTVYERLFALWHVLHLPLFLLLIVSTVIHVIAVHLY